MYDDIEYIPKSFHCIQIHERPGGSFGVMEEKDWKESNFRGDQGLVEILNGNSIMVRYRLKPKTLNTAPILEVLSKAMEAQGFNGDVTVTSPATSNSMTLTVRFDYGQK